MQDMYHKRFKYYIGKVGWEINVNEANFGKW